MRGVHGGAGEARTDPNTVLAALSRDRVRIELGTFDLCCLAMLHLQADRVSVASFTEDELVSVFEQVCDVVEPGADNPRKRATHAIQRLRDQHMLARVDGAGVVAAGEYTLTRLAVAVVAYFIEDETLTRESLTLLTRTLLGQLAQAKAGARSADSPQAWKDAVIGPLRVTVSDLVLGIERRQRGLDAAQEELRSRITELLQAGWFHAVDQAEALLEDTSRTLRELNEVLLRDTHQFLSLLQDIEEFADAAGAVEAVEAVRRVTDQVDRIAAWGRARQAAWSDYYQRVHRYLRDVVRIDPDRALSRRLRDQLAGWVERPFFLAVCREPAFPHLRPVQVPLDRPEVSRPRADRERDPAPVAPVDEAADLEALVRTALAAGRTGLAEVTRVVLDELPPSRRFEAAGRVAAMVARLARPAAERERPWVPVRDGLEIEDWSLSRGKR